MLIEIVIHLDEKGFGLDRKELCNWTASMERVKGLKHVLCGKNCFYNFMDRAEIMYPDFCESGRSSIDRKRAAKHAPAVFDSFLQMVQKKYNELYTNNILLTPSPKAHSVFNLDEIHFNPEKKTSKDAETRRTF